MLGIRSLLLACLPAPALAFSHGALPAQYADNKPGHVFQVFWETDGSTAVYATGYACTKTVPADFPRWSDGEAVVLVCLSQKSAPHPGKLCEENGLLLVDVTGDVFLMYADRNWRCEVQVGKQTDAEVMICNHFKPRE